MIEFTLNYSTGMAKKQKLCYNSIENLFRKKGFTMVFLIILIVLILLYVFLLIPRLPAATCPR